MDDDGAAPGPEAAAAGIARPPKGLAGAEEAAFAAAVVRGEHAADDHLHGHYKQELSRSIGLAGNVLITLSGLTPAASVFVIAPAALVGAGSGSFWSFVFAALVGVLMAFCWAELSAAFPISGGDYALVGHSFKGRASPLSEPMSFITFALNVDFIAFIPATIALGAGTYFAVIANVDPRYVGAVIMLIATALAVLKIHLNAILTGIFLMVELACLAVLTVLGLAHAKNWHSLAHPVIGAAHGALVPVAFSGIIGFTAVAVFSYNGYSNAVNFAEETTGSRRTIARAILTALAIGVLAEFVPFAATIIGAPSLATLTTSADPLGYFITATGGSWLNDAVSIGICLAILNAVLAIILIYGRILYSAARDRAFPGPVSKWFTSLHPRYRSPWIATIFIGILGAALCLGVSLNTLVDLTGASLVADYALIALAALVARPVGATRDGTYKMPAWPLPPLLALAALGYVFTQQARLLLEVTLITMAIGLVYWLVVLLPQKGKAWTLLQAPLDD
jgi:amino acid transporter